MTTTKPHNPHLDVPAIPGFRAVEESRKWRIATGKMLREMAPEKRIAFLNRRIADFPKTRTEKASHQ